MKSGVFILLFIAAVIAEASVTREQGESLMAKFKNCTGGDVVTNNADCIITVVDNNCEYKFCYTIENRALRRARVQQPDGSVDVFDYRDGRLDSMSRLSSNLTNMTVSLFLAGEKGSNSVDRMEFDAVDGKIVGPMRLYNVQDQRITTRPVKSGSSPRKMFDMEYVPCEGSTGKIGPYDWTVVGLDGNSMREVLSRNGKKVMESQFALDGKYPWIVGFAYERYESANRQELVDKCIKPNSVHGGVHYYFVIDMRSDCVEYISLDNAAEIKRITGKSVQSYNFRGFWYYFLSNSAYARWAKLEESLKPTVGKTESQSEETKER